MIAWIPTIVTMVLSLIGALNDPIQQYVSAHPAASLILGGVYAIIKGVLPSPMQTPPVKALAWLLLIPAGLLGCSAAQIKTDEAIFLQLKASAQTMLITGCTNLPMTEVAISTVMQFVPAGTTKEAAAAGLTLTGTVANALCASLMTPAAPAVSPTPGP